MYSFAFPLSDRNSQTPKKFQPCFQSFFPFPLSFPVKEKSPGNKVDSPLRQDQRDCHFSEVSGL